MTGTRIPGLRGHGRMAVLALGAFVALLLLAPSAWAGGTWGSKGDFTNLNVQFSDDGGNPMFFTVFTLPVPVQAAKTSDGRDCQVGQPDGNPNEVECPVNHVPNGTAIVLTKQPMPCTASMQNK